MLSVLPHQAWHLPALRHTQLPKAHQENRDGENPDSDPKTQKLVKFLGASSTKIKMKKDEQFTGVFRVEVLQEVGFGIFEVVAKAKGIESKDVLEVPFHSQKPVEREITQIHMSDVLGESLEGKLGQNPWRKPLRSS